MTVPCTGGKIRQNEQGFCLTLRRADYSAFFPFVRLV
jgi:hypothetical protein